MDLFLKYIKHFKPCSESIEFLKTTKTLEEAWNKCNKISWIFWILDKFSFINEKELIVFAIDCIKHIQHLIPNNQNLDLFGLSEQFEKNQISHEELMSKIYVFRKSNPHLSENKNVKNAERALYHLSGKECWWSVAYWCNRAGLDMNIMVNEFRNKIKWCEVEKQLNSVLDKSKNSLI